MSPVFALENAAWPVLLVDAAGHVRHSNIGAKKVFGPVLQTKPDLASSVWSRENEKNAPDFLKETISQPGQSFEVRLRSRDGNTCSYNTHICPVPLGADHGFLLQFFKVEPLPLEDPAPPAPPPPSAIVPTSPEVQVRETTVLEATAAHKQKLDCALQLTRTVALDFNNALTSILGHTSLILSKMEAKHPWRNSLVEVEKSAEKAAEIAHDLAAFSMNDKDAQTHQAGNINELLRRTVEVFQEKTPETIVWKFDLEHKIYSARFDEAKLQQAIVKVVENAVQAVEGFGTIYLRSTNVEVETGVKDAQIRLGPGCYICIELVDTGHGIPPSILPRIFEPFFTTRKDQGHRGLGLAWVYGIITNHGGSVAITSELNHGTAVRLYLPAQKKVVRGHSTGPANLSGTQTILMIDDEDLLLTMGEMVLSSYGYTVLTAISGQKALEIFSEKSDLIDLVITDLVMPQMNGRELIERLRKISPKVKVICASGYVRPPNVGEDDTYLQKPFASQDLLRKVKQILEMDTDKI